MHLQAELSNLDQLKGSLRKVSRRKSDMDTFDYAKSNLYEVINNVMEIFFSIYCAEEEES